MIAHLEMHRRWGWLHELACDPDFDADAFQRTVRHVLPLTLPNYLLQPGAIWLLKLVSDLSRPAVEIRVGAAALALSIIFEGEDEALYSRIARNLRLPLAEVEEVMLRLLPTMPANVI